MHSSLPALPGGSFFSTTIHELHLLNYLDTIISYLVIHIVYYDENVYKRLR